MRLPLLCLVLLAAVGCKDECDPKLDLPYCEGRAVVYCSEPGVDQIVNAVNRWSRQECRADQLCVEKPEAGLALCALSAEPEPACAGDVSSACESSTSHLYCQSGYATSRSACLSCEPESTSARCVGGMSSRCTASTQCVPGLVCGELGYCRKP